MGPIKERLWLPRTCLSRWPNTRECHSLEPVGTCWFAQHRPAYFASSEECAGKPPDGCATQPGGPGVGNTDFILYVTSYASMDGVQYCSKGTVALGAPCEFEPKTFRPISGNINFCPGLMRATPQPEVLSTGSFLVSPPRYGV